MTLVAGRPRTPIPVNVLTGFLGAGKTTLLSRHLKSPALADTAVIVNEFGEISLDHLLIETSDENIVELRGGCLCCQIQGDLISTLEDLLRRRDNGRVHPFRRVIIETTGLADPAPVLHALMLNPYLVLRYALASVITAVDALTGAETLNAHVESVRQVAVADRIVITKTDLADPHGETGFPELENRLRSLNPSAWIVRAEAPEAVPERLFEARLYNPENKSVDVANWLRAAAYPDGPDHNAHHTDAHHHGHKHDVNRHDARIKAFSISHEQPIGIAALELFFDLLRSSHGKGLLRMKGIVTTIEEPDRPLVVHGVQHVFHPPVFLDAWPDTDHTTRLVFIMYDGDEAAIRALFSAIAAPSSDKIVGALAPVNPLATPGTGPFKPV